MTQDEIIEMARSLGICELTSKPKQSIHYSLTIHAMEAFAKLVAAKEREEIAQFLERTQLGSLPEETALQYARLLKTFATSIRTRGEA